MPRRQLSNAEKQLTGSKPGPELTAGELVKPDNLSPYASTAWDKLLSQLKASGIILAPAHAALLALCSTLQSDIQSCWEALQKNGSDYVTLANGSLKLHPAASRLDMLRRDLSKNLVAIGLSRPVAAEPERDKSQDVFG